jgi:hypothetical protein
MLKLDARQISAALIGASSLSALSAIALRSPQARAEMVYSSDRDGHHLAHFLAKIGGRKSTLTLVQVRHTDESACCV